MRKHSSTVDGITGCELILSEASFNMAGDWLNQWFTRWGWEIAQVKPTTYKSRQVTMIVGKHHKQSRTFYYDEERGYLLGV